MLVHTNRIVTIKRMTTTGQKRGFLEVQTGLAVYINQNGDEPLAGIDDSPDFYAHKMLTDGVHEAIEIGDKIEDDKGNKFEVRGKSVWDDMTGIHHQYLLTTWIS